MKTIALWAFLLGTVRCGDYSEMSKCAADPKNITLKICCNQRCHCEAQSVLKEIHKHIPEGYIKFSERHYFKAYQERLTWLEAMMVCDKEGAYLAGINSEAESRFLAAMWPPTHDWAYVGYSDLYEEGNFVTVHNQSIRGAEYPKWAGGEPNGKTVENCGVIRPEMLLIDIKCTDKNPFFCEFEY